jgi:thiol:disulfide interchange protein DsbA
MDSRRRALIAALALTPLAGYAQARRPAPGVDYSVIKPAQPVEAKGKIEVLEFFWYGCPHCYTLEPLLEK